MEAWLFIMIGYFICTAVVCSIIGIVEYIERRKK